MKPAHNTNSTVTSIIISILLILVSTLTAEASGIPSASRKKTNIQEVDTAIFTRVDTELQEITVRPKKQKYTKKGNPAVELMQRIRAAASSGNPEEEDWYSFDVYDKTILGINDFNIKDTTNRSAMGFLKEYVDTVPGSDRTFLNLSLKERLSTVINRHEPHSSKTIDRGARSVGIDESFEQQNIRKMLRDALREINIFDNDIPLMQNRFVSPLSHIAADYYKFFITDTLDVDGIRCIELSFAPHSPESFSFNGKLYVEADSASNFIRKVTMRVPRVLNLNFVDNIFITQTFERDSLGKRHKTLDDMRVDLQLIPGTPSFYGRRQTIYDNFSYSPREDFIGYYDKLGSIIEEEGFEERTEEFWKSNRMRQLSRQEAGMDDMMGRMRGNKVFYWGEKIIRVLARSYVGTGLRGAPSKFDYGPVLSTVSFGEVEGMRIRGGGFTTAALNPHWFGRGFLAYGTKDKKFKYRLEAEYSFNKKKRHAKEFPVHSISASHEYDLFKIGQKYLQSGGDNILLSIARMKSVLVTYRKETRLGYKLELENNLSFDISLNHQIQEATPWVRFIKGDGSTASGFSQTSARFEIRYAPGEVFTQGATNRAPINMDAPVFTLTHEYGPKGVFSAPFGINQTEASVFKRIWFSSFGYLDTMVKGGVIWSKVPYTSLLWANANVSYTIQRESYSLLNPMEFAQDRYVGIDMTYWMNGLIMNRLPLIKRLKLREVISFKGFLGSLSRRNNPESDPELYRFPADALCKQMHGRPYMEIGAGLDNIARIFRLDYVWRLTYRDTPGAPDSGLRVSLHLQF